MKPANSKRRLIIGGSIAGLTCICLFQATWKKQQATPVKPLDKSHAAAKIQPSPQSFPDHVARRPLAVTLSKNKHQWTSENAMDEAVIEQIAHNPEEAIRLIKENDHIKRRQLVYRNETVPMLLERAVGTGGELKSFTLPGLDGREVEVEVTGVHFANGLTGGSVNGRVKGRLNSIVSVGFSNGCESFNVIDPDEGVFLTADAREPGEVLVKEIDPNVYGRPPESSTPCVILTDNLGPGHQREHTSSK